MERAVDPETEVLALFIGKLSWNHQTEKPSEQSGYMYKSYGDFGNYCRRGYWEKTGLLVIQGNENPSSEASEHLDMA